MKRLCGLMATAAWFAGLVVPAGHAGSTGAVTALEGICLHQGGTFQPQVPPGLALCTDTDGFIVYSQVPGSNERSELVAIDRLCKAAGFGGVRPFGKGLPDGGFAVVAWGCYAAP